MELEVENGTSLRLTIESKARDLKPWTLLSIQSCDSLFK